MSVIGLFSLAKDGDQSALENLIHKFHPLMVKMALRSGRYDEDCYQECTMSLIMSVYKARIK